MKYMAVCLIAVLPLAAMAGEPTSGESQKGGKHGQNRPTFEEVDQNSDGWIDEAEFYEKRSQRIAERAAEGRQLKNLANAPAFSDLDTDADGKVSTEEFALHQAGR